MGKLRLQRRDCSFRTVLVLSLLLSCGLLPVIARHSSLRSLLQISEGEDTSYEFIFNKRELLKTRPAPVGYPPPPKVSTPPYLSPSPTQS